MLSKLFLYLLVAYGITNLFVFGSGPFKIFEWIRYYAYQINNHLGQQLTCMMCLPWYIGMTASVCNHFFFTTAFTPAYLIYPSINWWWALIIDGFFTSAIVWLIHNIETFFENKSKLKVNTNFVDDNVIITEDITRKD